MTDNIIVMPGPATFDFETLHAVARDFGWTVGLAADLREIAAAQPCSRTTTVLFHRKAFGSSCSWQDAIRLIRSAVPEVRPIVCHEFSELIDWTALSDAGAFHSLWLPLKESEVRRSFGFIWEAEKRLAEAAERIPAIMPGRKPAATRRISPVLAHTIRPVVMVSAVS